jgi:NRAMP (natural resistance-associated macrophage protein)-like metal ion transporter
MSDTPPSSLKLFDIPIDPPSVRFSWRTLMKYMGPGWIMSLAFIDPGNIEADLQSGAFTGFSFIWVLLVAHIAGLVIQTFAARLGVVSGHGLARVCRDHYPHYLNLFLWLMAELAIIASDVQEVVGSSIALNLLFGWPLWKGVVATGLTTVGFLVMYLYRGLEFIEIIVITTIGGIFFCFSFDLVSSGPDVVALVKGLVVPTAPATAAETTQLVALIGSVVMPHNLFLHSSMIGKKFINRSSNPQMAQAIKYFVLDAIVALSCSFLINLSLQGSFAQGFYSPVCSQNPSGPLGCNPTILEPQMAVGCDMNECSCITSSGLPGFCSHIGLSNAGDALASILPQYATLLFGVGLLAAGQASTVSGTMAGQYVMEGFVDLRVPFCLRMLVTRGIALVPAIVVSLMQSEFTAMNSLSQSLNVLQSVQLPFALLPLLHFCAMGHVMGSFRLGRKTLSLTWILALSLISVNGYLLFQDMADLDTGWRIFASCLSVVYLGLLGWVLKSDLRYLWCRLRGKKFADSDNEGSGVMIKDHQIVHCDYHLLRT